MSTVVNEKKKTLEEKVIAHCAPTLAGIKTANLFSYRYESASVLDEELTAVSDKLKAKGVEMVVLKKNNSLALIYFYRRGKLEADLKKPGVEELLTGYGYPGCRLDECIEQLKIRLAECENFPHEIGVFLSYPLCDVIGFIEQKGQNCKYSGLWKVYCNENEAMKLFAKFKKCTDVYMQVFANGRTITQLTVAA